MRFAGRMYDPSGDPGARRSNPVKDDPSPSGDAETAAFGGIGRQGARGYARRLSGGQVPPVGWTSGRYREGQAPPKPNTLIAMFSAPRITNALPENAEVHVRVGWYRSPFGLPFPAPRIVIGNRHKRS